MVSNELARSVHQARLYTDQRLQLSCTRFYLVDLQLMVIFFFNVEVQLLSHSAPPKGCGVMSSSDVPGESVVSAASGWPQWHLCMLLGRKSIVTSNSLSIGLSHQLWLVWAMGLISFVENLAYPLFVLDVGYM